MSTNLVILNNIFLGDGTAVAKVFGELLNGEKRVSDELNSNHVSLFWSSAWNKIKLYFFGPYELICFGNLGSKLGWEPNTKIIRYNAAVTPTIPLEMIKNIRIAHKANFSAVVMVLIGRALNKFMKEAGYEVPERVCCTLARVVDSHPGTKLRNHM